MSKAQDREAKAAEIRRLLATEGEAVAGNTQGFNRDDTTRSATSTTTTDSKTVRGRSKWTRSTVCRR